MASSVVNPPTLLKSIVTKIAAKIKSEMKELSSDAHDFILRDTVEVVKRFSWELVKLELENKVPTLMTLLAEMVGKPAERTPLIRFIASQLLKCNHQRISLVPCAISVMLYGNGTSKQVRIIISITSSFICIALCTTNHIVLHRMRVEQCTGVLKPATTQCLFDT